jgi:hypothetical protein
MFSLVNFSVPLGELRVGHSLLPLRHWKVAGLVAAKEHQTPFCGSLASPGPHFRGPCQSGVIKLAHGVAGAAHTAPKFVLRFAHPKPDHAVVAAVVAVD